MVERFGILTIIVLGEVIAGVVQGIASHQQLTWVIGIIAALRMLIAIGIWWVYFDFVSSHSPKKGLITEASWVYHN